MSNTPRLGHKPVEMKRLLPDVTDEFVESLEWQDLGGGRRVKRFPQNPKNVGEFYWDLQDGKRKLVVGIPTAPSEDWPDFLLSTWTIDHENNNRAQWGWDGNEDAPTLTPSIHAVGAWHGWVQNGELVEA